MLRHAAKVMTKTPQSTTFSCCGQERMRCSFHSVKEERERRPELPKGLIEQASFAHCSCIDRTFFDEVALRRCMQVLTLEPADNQLAEMVRVCDISTATFRIVPADDFLLHINGSKDPVISFHVNRKQDQLKIEK